MPRPTAQELREARERKRQQEEYERQAVEEARLQAEAERTRRREELQEQLLAARRRQVTTAGLDSSGTAIYTELDKLSKKAPKEQVTDLQLEYINNIIQAGKQLVPEDDLLQRVDHFEAAGDNPEYRDALFVISQVQAALRRFQRRIEVQVKQLEQELAQQKNEQEKAARTSWNGNR